MTFKNQLNFDFSGVSMKDRVYSDQTKVENKMLMKVQKHNFKNSRRIVNDINAIQRVVGECREDEQILLISKCFNSPNIVNAFIPEIVNLYVATWAITPAGIDSLLNIVNNGHAKEIYLLLDKTHSYKWLFTSNAYNILKGKVKIKFCANHSKFICIETKNGFLNFVGSMNFSNNPRFENITINRNKDDYIFYRDYVKNVGGEVL